MRPALMLSSLLCVAACTSYPESPPPASPDPVAVLADRAQTLCPVMAGKLINRRLYVDYQGTRIYVCCNACVKAVRRDPEKYLQKLRSQ